MKAEHPGVTVDELTRERYPPPRRVRAHNYGPDLMLPKDHRGERPCIHCGLPKRNLCHVNEDPDDTRQRRAAAA